MKTAMQELEDKIKNNLQWIVMNADYELMEKLFKEGFEKEKEQIIKARNDGFDAYARHKGLLTHEQYYNQNYNQNK